MHTRSKLTSEIFQKIGCSDGKIKQNSLKAPTLLPFPQKKKKKNLQNLYVYD